MEDAGVTIPLSWFLGTIATLGGAIVAVARELFKLQNVRATEIRDDTKLVTQALNDNTAALDKMTTALTSGGN